MPACGSMAGGLSCPACGSVADVARLRLVGAPWLCPPAPPVARSRLSESSRNTPAATIRSPSLSPLRTSTRSANCTPSVTARGSNRSPVATNTCCCRPVSTTASRGTVITTCPADSNAAVPYRPGLRLPPGLAAEKRTRSVRVRSVSVG